MTSREELEKKVDEIRKKINLPKYGFRVYRATFNEGFIACLDLTYPEIERLQQRVEKLRRASSDVVRALKLAYGNHYPALMIELSNLEKALEQDDANKDRNDDQK